MAEEKEEFKSVKNYKLIYQIYSQSIEEIYFWFIGWFKDNQREALAKDNPIEKITDIYAASESSAFFGAQSARAGIMQDRVANNLRTLSEMTKALFQIVRELRIIDMRLELYNKSMNSDDSECDSSEVALKGLYVDLVEGGAQNAASVYGLASRVGFTILPDLFFRIRIGMDPKTGEPTESVDDVVKKLEFNEKVKEVLARKLKQFYTWKKHTYKELTTRRSFQIKYLRQYHNSMKLYMAWVKPYLKYIRRLGMDTKKLDTVDLITGMEQSLMEMEILVKLKAKDGADYNGYLSLNFLYRTAPEMAYATKDYQHRGPIHVGRSEINFKAYSWNKKQYEAFKKQKEEEELDLLGSVDESLKESMDAVGDDLKKYIAELEGMKKKEEVPMVDLKGMNKFLANLFGMPTKVEQKKKVEKQQSILDPFVSIFRGLGELLDSLTGFKSKISKPSEKVDKWKVSSDEKAAKKNAQKKLWLAYNIFKKAHGMITW